MKSSKTNSVKLSPTKKPHAPANLSTSTKNLISRLKIDSGKKNIMEYSHIVQTLVSKRNVSIEEISQRTRICKSHIYNYMNISNMPTEVQQLIQEGRIAPTIALEVIRNIRNEDEIIEAINQYVADTDAQRKLNKQASIKIKGSATKIRKRIFSNVIKMVEAGFDIETMPKSLLRNLDKALKQFQHQASA